MWQRTVVKWYIVPIKDVTTDGEIYLELVLTGALAALGCGVWSIKSWVARIHYHLQAGSSCRGRGRLFIYFRFGACGHKWSRRCRPRAPRAHIDRGSAERPLLEVRRAETGMRNV